MFIPGRPAETEYAPFYAGYVKRVPDEKNFDLFALLGRQADVLRVLLATLTTEQESFRPGAGEWSIKEVIGHINDAERIFAYRAMRISRGDQTSLPGFEQDDFVHESNFSARTLADLLEEFDLQRRANILQFNRISPETSLRTGTASEASISVRAALYIMAGHVEHHLESLRTDYLPKL